MLSRTPVLRMTLYSPAPIYDTATGHYVPVGSGVRGHQEAPPRLGPLLREPGHFAV